MIPISYNALIDGNFVSAQMTANCPNGGEIMIQMAATALFTLDNPKNAQLPSNGEELVLVKHAI
jgi:hypothetical protein